MGAPHIPSYVVEADTAPITLTDRLAAAGVVSIFGLGLTLAAIGLLGAAEMVKDAVL